LTQTLNGKTAFITGAAAGMGRAIAETFLAAGARVIATDRNAAGLAGVGSEQHGLDVTDPAAVDTLAARIGRVDILVNCAGFVETGTLLESEEEQWHKSFELNVFAMARVTKAFLPAMLANGGGCIINIASVAGSVKGIPNRCIYSASKAAVIGLTKSVATDYLSGGIRCNAICPGTVDTPSLQQRLRDMGDYEAALKAFNARQPMGRMGRAGEIAELALYLASDAGAFATGQTFIIDGGLTL